MTKANTIHSFKLMNNKNNTDNINIIPNTLLDTEKNKVYELDFGDTILITEDKKDILNWIETDLDNIDENGLQYKITTKLMTRDEINALPEWA